MKTDDGGKSKDSNAARSLGQRCTRFQRAVPGRVWVFAARCMTIA
jgi:hypothetical protein